jgi:tripartite-type tricarboxylate transporter receptor subunit TctC
MLLSIGGPLPAHAQGGTVRIIVPFAPGAAIDVIGRLLANTMSTLTGRTVIVENRAGARTYLGAEAVARSEPDGDTMLLSVDDTFTMVPHLTKSVTFDPMKDLTPVATIGIISMVMVVNPSVPATTLPALVEYVKANPTAVNYGSSGVGSATQLAMEMLKAQAKIEITHVPYRGLTPATTAVLTNEVQVSILGYGTSRPMIEAGKMRAIAVTSPQRVPSLPDLPTTRELNFPDVQATPSLVLSVSAKTPPDIVKRLYDTITRAISDPKLRKQIESRDIIVTNLGPSQSLAEIERLSKLNAAAMKVAGVQPD